MLAQIFTAGICVEIEMSETLLTVLFSSPILCSSYSCTWSRTQTVGEYIDIRTPLGRQGEERHCNRTDICSILWHGPLPGAIRSKYISTT